MGRGKAGPNQYCQRIVSSDDTPLDDIHSGSGLVAEKAKRLQKLDDLRHQGTNPYPYRFDRTTTLAALRKEHGALEPGTETDTQVAVAGRVMLMRDSGKLIFATMRDRDDEVQLFISKAVVGDDAFDAI